MISPEGFIAALLIGIVVVMCLIVAVAVWRMRKKGRKEKEVLTKQGWSAKSEKKTISEEGAERTSIITRIKAPDIFTVSVIVKDRLLYDREYKQAKLIESPIKNGVKFWTFETEVYRGEKLTVRSSLCGGYTFERKIEQVDS